MEDVCRGYCVRQLTAKGGVSPGPTINGNINDHSAPL